MRLLPTTIFLLFFASGYLGSCSSHTDDNYQYGDWNNIGDASLALAGQGSPDVPRGSGGAYGVDLACGGSSCETPEVDQVQCPRDANCAGRACGVDPVCGLSCGICPTGYECQVGQCILSECIPNCAGMTCGLDPVCGESCGTCEDNETCSNNQCVCVPQCPAGKCGDDGCGGSCGVCPVVDLRADINRNGIVDMDDPSEDLGEDAWDKDYGAVFLANIDDDQKSCPTTGTDAQLAACNDADDEQINGADDLLDLARLKTRPWPEASNSAVGSIAISSPGDGFVRLFKNSGGTFTVFNPATDTLTATEIRAGVEFAIEGKDVVRDTAVWDGFIDVTFTIDDADVPGPDSDTVRMREAPLITRHHLDPPLRVYASPDIFLSGSTDFVNGLKSALSAAGISEPLDELPVDTDQWTQDYFETAYMSMPATGGQQIIHVNIRAACGNMSLDGFFNPLRSSGRVVFTAMRGKDVAGLQQYDPNHSRQMDSLDSFGNLETIPPYSYNGKNYPLGRIFRGKTSTYYPDKSVLQLFESQKVQPPVYVDTSWLAVGHVDETISFVRADSPRKWAILANDTKLAREMLEQQVTAGNGDVKMFVGKELPTQSIYFSNTDGISISDVLNDTDIMSSSSEAAVEVSAQLEVLKKETGITDEEIVRIPYLFESMTVGSVAYQVGTINGISLGDEHFGAPEPHGPVIGGEDIMKTQFEQALGELGIQVHWIEDWSAYHILEGEVHCGSNTTRQVPADVKWWESGL